MESESSIESTLHESLLFDFGNGSSHHSRSHSQHNNNNNGHRIQSGSSHSRFADQSSRSIASFESSFAADDMAFDLDGLCLSDQEDDDDNEEEEEKTITSITTTIITTMAMTMMVMILFSWQTTLKAVLSLRTMKVKRLRFSFRQWQREVSRPNTTTSRMKCHVMTVFTASSPCWHWTRLTRVKGMEAALFASFGTTSDLGKEGESHLESSSNWPLGVEGDGSTTDYSETDESSHGSRREILKSRKRENSLRNMGKKGRLVRTLTQQSGQQEPVARSA